ncbi:nucleoid-associated protein [Aeromonas aquatica]|uniref:nucleoid-associated protein n=1 Tax=Aeromonas aquatica TaxID=558964 RepID=UPI00068DB7C6|nr:nucleoid-associated protein [Aeromonas aquatica]
MSAPAVIEVSEIIESQNVINSVIVHDLTKKDGVLAIDERHDLLPVTRTVQRLVDQLIHVYGKRPGKSFGHFESDEENYPVQKYVREYYVGKSKSFIELTISMMKTLCAKAMKTAATGGHVFIAHTKRDASDYLLVAILTDEIGAALTEGKDVEDSVYLDIKGFRLAGKIDMTSWNAGSERYLSFLKGRDQAKVSDYFKAFLGCDNSVAAAAETATLIKGLESFATKREMNEIEKEAFLSKAHAICSKFSKEDEPFDIQAFSNELWPNTPDELVEELSDPELKLSEGFVPDRRVLRKLVKFSGQTKSWKFECDRTALNEKHVLFNTDETLTITNVPDELKTRLRNELRQDDGDDE